VHRASLPVLGSTGVAQALQYARSRGIRVLGASVKEAPAAEAALADERFSLVQIPFNRINSTMEPAFAMARERGKQVLVNRPFGEGRLLYGDGNAERGEAARVEAFRFILAHRFSGFILAGTSSPLHLQQNIAAFEAAAHDD
jgi:aryl-alcohol dehydrogenase-like predicted oxidoreductase